jgi:hypothetical protein
MLKSVKSFRMVMQRDQQIQSMALAALSQSQAAAPKGTESLDFDLHEKNQLRATAELPRDVRLVLERRRTWLSHLFILVMGVLVGVIAFTLSKAVSEMSRAKWAWVREAVHEGHFYLGWLRLVAACCGFVLCASLLTYWAPEAAGSGIPHVKSYLNGNKLPGVLRLRVLVAKVLGIACCVAAGIPVGREGPMVHAGAIIAAGLARLWAFLVVFQLPQSKASVHGTSTALATSRAVPQHAAVLGRANVNDAPVAEKPLGGAPAGGAIAAARRLEREVGRARQKMAEAADRP